MTSQTELLHQALLDGRPHRSDNLVREVYGLGEGTWLARLGARVWDLKQKGIEIKGWKAPENKKLYYYQLIYKQDLFAA